MDTNAQQNTGLDSGNLAGGLDGKITSFVDKVMKDVSGGTPILRWADLSFRHLNLGRSTSLYLHQYVKGVLATFEVQVEREDPVFSWVDDRRFELCLGAPVSVARNQDEHNPDATVSCLGRQWVWPMHRFGSIDAQLSKRVDEIISYDQSRIGNHLKQRVGQLGEEGFVIMDCFDAPRGSETTEYFLVPYAPIIAQVRKKEAELLEGRLGVVGFDGSSAPRFDLSFQACIASPDRCLSIPTDPRGFSAEAKYQPVRFYQNSPDHRSTVWGLIEWVDQSCSMSPNFLVRDLVLAELGANPNYALVHSLRTRQEELFAIQAGVEKAIEKFYQASSGAGKDPSKPGLERMAIEGAV